MIFGPVGIRCPDCSGKQAGKPTLRKQKPSLTRITSSDIVTRSIVSLVVLVYIAQVAESGSISGTGQLIVDGALYGPSVKAGEWWRLITSAFLHSGPIHLIFNALILWWFGRSLENLIGSRRFLGLYAISLLAGAAGALLFSPNSLTVGASGAVFGVLGAGLVLERRGVMVFGGAALPIVAFNILLSFIIPRISIGGHLGGLLGGAIVILILSHLGKKNPAQTRIGPLVILGLAAVTVLAVLVSYLRVSI